MVRVMYFQVSNNNCQQRWLYTAATSASSCLEYCSEPLTHGNLERSTQHSQKLVAKQAKSVNSQTTNHATGATIGGFIKSAMIISVKRKLTIVTKRGNQMLPPLFQTIYKEEEIKKTIVITTIALFVGELRVSSTAPLTTSAKYTTWRMAENIRTPAAIRRHSDLVSCMKINV